MYRISTYRLNRPCYYLDAHGTSHNKGIYFQENDVHQSILEHQGSENDEIWDGTTYVTIGDSTGDIHTIGNISGSNIQLVHLDWYYKMVMSYQHS